MSMIRSLPTVPETPPEEAASGDWASRIAGSGVVWYHDFDSAAEVNQFRFTNGYSGGDDPLQNGADSNLVAWQSSGGQDGGGFMRLTYPVNTSPNTCYWARPFLALTGAGNGRGVDDPGANGSITPQSWSVSDGSSVSFSCISTRTNPGFYGPAGRQAIYPAKFQGTDYYVQVAVRRAQTPGPPPDNLPNYTNINGKLVWFTNTGPSFTNGEIVNWGQSVTLPDVVGTQGYLNAYTFTGDFAGIAHKTGGTVLVNNETIQRRYTGGWDTFLFHVTPGEIGGTGDQRTRYEVWMQRDLSLFPAENGLYTKIWDVYFPASYETGLDPAGGQYAGGWNCLNLAIYHNGSTFTTSTFNYDFDKLIFSKNFIAAPTAPTALETRFAGMASGTWEQHTTVTGQNAALGVGPTSGSAIHYCNQMPWNPIRKAIEIIAMDHNAGAQRYMRYDALTDAFVTVSADDGVGTATRHGYGHNTVNPATGDVYHRLAEYDFEGSGLLVYKVAYPGDTLAAMARVDKLFYMQNGIASCWWTGSFTGGGAQGTLIIYNSGDSNVPPGSSNDGGIYCYDPVANSWFYTSRGKTPFYGDTSDQTYHSVMAYSSIKNCAVMGGGNANNKKLWRLNSDRTTTAMPDAPSGCTIGVQAGILCENPVNGNFLVLSNNNLYELNPSGSGSWTTLTGGSVPPSGLNPTGGANGVTCTPIPAYRGIVYIQQTGSTGGTVWCYKC